MPVGFFVGTKMTGYASANTAGAVGTAYVNIFSGTKNGIIEARNGQGQFLPDLKMQDICPTFGR